MIHVWDIVFTFFSNNGLDNLLGISFISDSHTKLKVSRSASGLAADCRCSVWEEFSIGVQPLTMFCTSPKFCLLLYLSIVYSENKLLHQMLSNYSSIDSFLLYTFAKGY